MGDRAAGSRRARAAVASPYARTGTTRVRGSGWPRASAGLLGTGRPVAEVDRVEGAAGQGQGSAAMEGSRRPRNDRACWPGGADLSIV
jgi:hypothetical protein